MKKINGLRNMQSISRGALIEALQGKTCGHGGINPYPL
nr:MAG TPA: hypothetical protein [Caudoviricetes sp.]